MLEEVVEEVVATALAAVVVARATATGTLVEVELVVSEPVVPTATVTMAVAA